MKYFLISFLFCTLASDAFSQEPGLPDFNEKRLQISKTGINVLSVYAIANIATGIVASANTSGTTKYFHQMNAIWNGVTLGIVAIGKLTANKEGELTLLQSLKAQNKIEKLFLFNVGLDLAYIAGGAYLRERAKTTTKKPKRLKGYGESVMLQGAVLLFFDGAMYAIHNKHGKKLEKLATVQIGFTGNGIGAVVRL